METPADIIKDLLQKKLLLYQDMLACLTLEKESIIKADVESLWDFSEKKHDIASKIEEVRGSILHTLEQNSINHEMDTSAINIGRIIALLPAGTAGKLDSVHVSLLNIKMEVHALSKENRAYVENYLSVLDELIGIIANVGSTGDVYTDSRFNKEKTKTNIFLHQEI